MNKTIKVIDLLNEVSRGNNLTFKDGGETYKDSLWTFINMYMDKRQSFKEIQELLNSEVILVEDNTEEIEELDTLNAYKLMESPYMAKLLKEQRYDEFMEHLKQSEVEIANTIMKAEDKINELVKVVNEIRKKKE